MKVCVTEPSFYVSISSEAKEMAQKNNRIMKENDRRKGD